MSTTAPVRCCYVCGNPIIGACLITDKGNVHSSCVHLSDRNGEIARQAATISQLQAEIARYREALRSAETALASEYEIRGEFDTTYPLPVGPILSVVRSALGPISPRKFSLGHRVRKVKGSSWQGHVVGFYSTQMTPIGYCIESEREPGSVQLYPESALDRAALGGSNDKG